MDRSFIVADCIPTLMFLQVWYLHHYDGNLSLFTEKTAKTAKKASKNANTACNNGVKEFAPTANHRRDTAANGHSSTRRSCLRSERCRYRRSPQPGRGMEV